MLKIRSKCNPLLPVSCLDLECCSSPRGFIRPVIPMKARASAHRLQSASAFRLLILIWLYWLHHSVCSFVALWRGRWRCRQAYARTPHHAREARASFRRREFPATTLKGLGGIGPAFPMKRKRSSAGSLAHGYEKG